tara:strand:- start:1471 stop:2508 length:1038 start_codon:yes stop_codon:yes gene_type:complete
MKGLNRPKYNKKWLEAFSFIVSILFTQISLNASETDNYLAWDKEIQDSTEEINRYYNELMVNALRKVKRRPFMRKKCERVATWIGKSIVKIDQKYTDHWVKKNKKIDRFPKYGTKKWDYLKKTIYKKVLKLGVNMSPTININGIYMGSDKISHFFGIGLVYYGFYLKKLKTMKMKKSSLPIQKRQMKAVKHALDLGILTERVFLGESAMASGVFSYGDMESNYQGLKFFRSLCEGKTPRIKKVSKHTWKLVRPLDIKSYANPKWDETFYSNHYQKSRWKHVKPYLKKYCKDRFKPIVRERFEYYKSIDYESFSSRYLKEKAKAGKLPDPLEHSLDRLCQNQQIKP